MPRLAAYPIEVGMGPEKRLLDISNDVRKPKVTEKILEGIVPYRVKQDYDGKDVRLQISLQFL